MARIRPQISVPLALHFPSRPSFFLTPPPQTRAGWMGQIRPASSNTEHDAQDYVLKTLYER